MLAPATPLDEEYRLAALHGLKILDTPHEERFDRLTRLAQLMLNVPIAMVSLVDSNRQWFKSCQGLDASETARSISFCGHAILDDQIFVIPDALLDPRFADNPLVTGAPHIRFYAGQPLKAANGSRLGTLCVIDRRPHQLTQAEGDGLRDLARLVENELNSLEFQESAIALQNSKNRLTAILDNVLDGIITINDLGTVESFNKSAEQIFGYPASEVIGNNVKMLMPEPYHSEHDSYLNNFVTTGKKKIIGIGRQVVGRRKDGSTFPMELAVSEMLLGGKRMFNGIVRDITERKKGEEDYANISRLSQAVVDGADHLIITTDTQGFIRSFNRAAESHLGYRADEVIGKFPAMFHDKDELLSRAKALAGKDGHVPVDFEVFVARARQGSSGDTHEWTYIRKDGSRFPVSLTISALRNALGEICGFLGIATDITEQKHAAQMQRENESRLAAILDNVLDGIITINELGFVESFNKSATVIFGYTAAEVIGNNVKMLMPEPYHSEHDDYLHNYVSTGKKKVIGIGRQVVGQRKDGSTFPMDLAVSEMRLGDKRIFTGIVRDITERRKVERIQAQFKAIIESSNDAIMSKTLDGIVTSWNPAAERMFGYTEQEMLGKPMALLMPPDRAGEESQILAKIARGEHINHFETTRRKKSGETFPISVTISPITDADGTITGASKIARDITERVKIERMKSEFISTVSHELRTPLTSIRGSLGLIAGGVAGELPAQARALVDIAHKNSERLILLVNDILDMEKIEAGKMEFSFAPTEAAALLHQSLEGNRAYAEQFKVTYELADKIPEVMVNVDANRLLQVLANLLSNAAKFSPAGGKVIVAATKNGNRIRVTVSDHGSGIPEQFRSRIFQKFAQADASDTRKKGGTGLGLSITKAIVEQMGGHIGFESQPDVLTTFWVEFPVWQEAETVAPVSSKADRRKCVLVCEDDHDIASLLKMMMEQAGLEADLAYDAAQAKHMLAQRSYAAMTIDLGLPGQDGISLIRELRTLKKTADLPILVISAKAAEGQKELSGEAFNVIDWIRKPIDQEHLVAALRQAVGQVSQARPIVLHVEDDPDIVQVVSSIVGDVADVEKAQCLADARRMLAGKHYDLVILDLALPDGSGKELLPLLNNATPPIPVMVFSANEMGTKEIKAVDSALVKSRTDNVQLLSTIKRLIGIE